MGVRFEKKQVVVIILSVLVYAALDELHQYFVPGRSCTMYDWITDGFGALMGFLLAWLIKQK